MSADRIVKARYMGNPSSMRIETDDPEDTGHEIELQPRHVYDLPIKVVADRDDFIIQDSEETERAVEDAPEKRTKER